MEIRVKISKYGKLFIEREGKMKNQYCPHSFSFENYTECGDICPLFHEPEYNRFGKVLIKLCRTEYYINIDNFKDERK